MSKGSFVRESSEVPKTSSSRLLSEGDREQSAWDMGDYAEQETHQILSRLSKSQVSLEQLVEIAQEHDPTLFHKVVATVIEDQLTEQKGVNKWAATPIHLLVEELESDLKSGLSDTQVLKNREKYGPNQLQKEKSEPIWRIFLSQFTSFVVLLLLAASLVAIGFGEYAEGVVILLIVFFNATLATYMEKSAGDALAKLASMAAPKCKCIRNGAEKIIDAVDLVPGDIVKIESGDNIPSDLRCVEIIELKTNEALLTGESEDIKKTLVAKDPTSPFANNLCFASTFCTMGSATTMVICTGMETQVGRIAKQLAKESAKGTKLTPLQQALNRLGGLIGIMAICVLAVVVVVAIVTGYEDPSHPDADPVLQIILIAVGFAVSSIPEGLPMVVTICLALGCRDMVKLNANVRKLPAVETLGCCTVVCSDKTGTLTEGKMTAVSMGCICRGSKKSLKYRFYPTRGFDPIGGIFDEEELNDEKQAKIVKKVDSGDVTGFESVLQNFGSAEDKSADAQRVQATVLAAALNSYATDLNFDGKSKRWGTSGNMSEGAIVVAAAKSGFGTSLEHLANPHEMYPRDASLEVPFTSSRKMMSTIHKLPTSDIYNGISLKASGHQIYGVTLESEGQAFTHIAVVKGAPDRVIAKCRYILREDGGKNHVDWATQIEQHDLDQLQSINDDYSSKALRVLAVGIVPLTKACIDRLKTCEDADERLQVILKKPLIALGLLGSLDPPRFGVKAAIATCRAAGVIVTMITGDQKATASAVARDIGIVTSEEAEHRTALCSELHVDGDLQADYVAEEKLDAMTERIRVFSRAQPEDKIAIVNSLKRKGHVTAMTGDGVNDSPALKAADIGVAMGINGTDVAKGAAEMVLLDDNFVTIVHAIEEGRRIYGNIQKFVCFLLGTNIGEIIYLTTAIVAGMKMPVEALQIIFLNLASDGCPAVALCREPSDGDTMKRKPRRKTEHIVTKNLWIWSILPHTVFEALCVISALVVAMYMAAGVVRLDRISEQCRTFAVDGRDVRYLCKSFEYRLTMEYTGWITNVDYTVPSDEGTEIHQYLGFRMGRVDDSELDELALCKDPEQGDADDDGFCLPTQRTRSGYEFVTTRASKIATTQSFMAAVFCEAFRAYTVRSWDYVHQVFNRNSWMHFAISISTTATFGLTFIPWVNGIFGLQTVAWWQYLLSVSWGLLNVVLDETIPKALYRRFVLKHEEEAAKAEVERKDTGEPQKV